MKPNKCKYCGGTNHQSFRCYSKPNKESSKIKTSKPLKPKSGYSIPKVSERRAKDTIIYNKEKAKFKLTHTKCEAKLTGCSGSADHVHHMYSGADRDRYFTDSSTWKMLCNHCHHLVHDVLSVDEAYAMDLKRTY